MDDFAVFILSHGRPDHLITRKVLRDQGYTGKIYIIIDDEDPSQDRYLELYGQEIIIFSKREVEKTFDIGDNFQDRRGVVYARNAIFEIAARMGIRYFLELDDDYRAFVYKFTAGLEYTEKKVRNLDKLFVLMLAYYRSIPAAVTIAFGQNGDLVGGSASGNVESIHAKRKAMNTFFCDTQRPFQFSGRSNEDVVAYTSGGHRGEIYLTIFSVCIIQNRTQSNPGGMTELYMDQGTYVKSFYTVMYCPSFVRINMMGYIHRRIHHKILWENAVPKILSESCRKI